MTTVSDWMMAFEQELLDRGMMKSLALEYSGTKAARSTELFETGVSPATAADLELEALGHEQCPECRRILRSNPQRNGGRPFCKCGYVQPPDPE